MERTLWIVNQVYQHGVLNLLPRRFRLNFGEEMQAVFALSLREAAGQGRAAVLALLWREFISLPGAVFGPRGWSPRRH